MALKQSLQIIGTKSICEDGIAYQMGTESITTDPLYIKIAFVGGTKDVMKVVVSFIQESTNQPIGSREYKFTLNLDGPNPIKQAYLHLKTLSEFADATDC